MESHKNMQLILKEVVKAAEFLKPDLEQFEKLTDNLKDNTEDLRDAQKLVESYNNENVDVNI